MHPSALQDFFADSADGAKARGRPPPKKPKTAEEQVRARCPPAGGILEFLSIPPVAFHFPRMQLHICVPAVE